MMVVLPLAGGQISRWQRRGLLITYQPLQSICADDNASGVVALLELARRWSQEPPNRPVWLVAFDQEEWGC